MIRVPPSAWAAVSTILAAFGVSYVPSDAVKAVIAAGASLVLAVWQWQHHRTKRHLASTTAELAARKIDAHTQQQAASVRLAELEAQHPAAGANLDGVLQAVSARVRELGDAVASLQRQHADPAPVGVLTSVPPPATSTGAAPNPNPTNGSTR